MECLLNSKHDHFIATFDNVRWPKLWMTLQELGVPPHVISLLKNLYEVSEAVIKIDNSLSNKCSIQEGVRQ